MKALLLFLILTATALQAAPFGDFARFAWALQKGVPATLKASVETKAERNADAVVKAVQGRTNATGLTVTKAGWTMAADHEGDVFTFALTISDAVGGTPQKFTFDLKRAELGK